MRPSSKARLRLGTVLAFGLNLAQVAASEALPQRPIAISPPSTNPGLAHIRFATTNYDFGKVVVGKAVKHQFYFTNTGTAPLMIYDVHSTCGCTSANLWSHQVEPGKTGIVPLEFFTGKFNGPVTKPVTVVCNDSNQPVVTLEIKGNVWHPIEVMPDAAMFSGYFGEPSNTVRVLQITNRQDQPLTLFEPQSSHRSIVSELRTNRIGQEYELEVKIVPPFGTGHIFGQVTMKTSSPEMPVLTVRVWALAQPAVMALPRQVELPSGPIVSNLTRSVSFRNNASTPLAISEPTVNVPGVGLQLHELQKGQFFTLLLNFPQGFEVPPGKDSALLVRSSNPLFPVIKVPIVVPAASPPAGKATGGIAPAGSSPRQ